MVNRPNAAQAASSGHAEDDPSVPVVGLAGEHVDDAAEQHRLGELRASQQQIGAGENPAQPRFLAEQIRGRECKGEAAT